MELRQHFSQSMSVLYQNILRMGTMVEEAHQKALIALSDRDLGLAREVIEGDAKVDEMQATIEDQCARLIATEQPVATDMREIFTAVKIVSNMERIGDHARHVARAVEKVNDPTFLATIPRFKQLAQIGILMVHDVITAFVEQDADKAREIAGRDDQIDRMHDELTKELIALMKKNPESIEQGMTMILLARFMERMGDHVTNMCEWIVFAKQGRHIELNN